MKNQTIKYFKYAIGEIILVVIGILIALQINTWNQQRIDRKKEDNYLKELRVSLESDILEATKVLEFNIKKDSIVRNLMQIFNSNLTNNQRLAIIQNYATPFTNYEVFEPNSTTWNNFISSENINLIENKDLRKKLIEYYSFNYNGSIQERIKVMNRKVIDENFPKFFTKEYTLQNLNLETNLPSNSEFDMHLNQTLLSDFFGVRYLIKLQNEFIANTNNTIKTLIQLIDEHIN